ASTLPDRIKPSCGLIPDDTITAEVQQTPGRIRNAAQSWTLAALLTFHRSREGPTYVSTGPKIVYHRQEATRRLQSGLVERFDVRSEAVVKGLSTGPVSMAYLCFTMEITLSTCLCTLNVSEEASASDEPSELPNFKQGSASSHGLCDVQIATRQHDVSWEKLAEKSTALGQALVTDVSQHAPGHEGDNTLRSHTDQILQHIIACPHLLRRVHHPLLLLLLLLLLVAPGNRLLKGHREAVYDDSAVRVAGAQSRRQVLPELGSRGPKDGCGHQSGGHDVDHPVHCSGHGADFHAEAVGQVLVAEVKAKSHQRQQQLLELGELHILHPVHIDWSLQREYKYWRTGEGQHKPAITTTQNLDHIDQELGASGHGLLEDREVHGLEDDLAVVYYQLGTAFDLQL
ncbi:hypothetical protein INR49_026957, partial [Caranx melampygus]